jgi:hypothetical protein
MVQTGGQHMMDALTPEQHARVAAAHEAAQSILRDDPLAEEIVTVAHWIVTGEQPNVVHPTVEKMPQAAADRIAAWDTEGPLTEVTP